MPEQGNTNRTETKRVKKPARTKARTDATAEVEEPKTATNFTEAIYNAITMIFANKNPTQMFCLNWPGTILDAEHLGWDPNEETAGNMPERALIRSSHILDQYVPPSPITQPDGTRLSDRYKQAISQLGPKPNIDLIRLQEVIRKKLQVEVTVNIGDKEVTMRIVEYFEYLQRKWITARQEWGKLQAKMRDKFRAENPLDPNRAWDQYLEWYATNAEGHILAINLAYDELVAEFPLTAWQDAITVLDTSDDGGLGEAKQLLRNSMIPVPYQEGGDYYPTRGVPYNWPLQIKPSTKYIDLLADPEAQRQALEVARDELEQEILNWMAIIPQIDDAKIRADADAFQEAGQAFSDAQADLLKTYTQNAVTAVQIFADVMESRGKMLSQTPAGEQQGVVDEVNGLLGGLDASAGLPTSTVDWAQVKEIAEKVGEGQNDLIDAQQNLIDKGRVLAGAATKFLQGEAQRIEFGWLEPYIKQLESKLDDVKRRMAQFASASNVYYSYLNSPENLKAEEEAKAKGETIDPNRTNGFATNAFPSKLSYPPVSTWTQVTATIKTSMMKTEKTMNTFFETMQWGVDLFLASAGGSSEVSGTDFAEKFMEGEDEIQIAFLAAKVIIDRPWMKPEVFSHTKNFFRTLSKPLAPKPQMTHEQLMGPDNQGTLLSYLQDNSFPAYPVALLLAKDVTVKVKVKQAESEALRKTAKSVKSQGGGFLCFSVSKSEASSSEESSMSSYVMNGQMVARAPAPQIIGYWNQFLPPDEATLIDEQVAEDIGQAISFVGMLQQAHNAPPEKFEMPTR